VVKKFSSSPGVSDLAASGYNAGNTTAFQQVAQGIIGGTIGPNRWLDETNPYLQYIDAADEFAKNNAFQNIFRGLVDSKSPAAGYRNAWEYLQDTMRKMKMSSGKTALGIPTVEDMNGLENVIRATIGSNATDPIAWLQAASVGYKGDEVKQLDTTPQFTRQAQKALQLKDWGDAKAALYDSYYAAFGVAPTDDLVSKLEKQWNAEVRKQTTYTVTEGKTSYEPVYTDKPVYDKTKPVLGKNGKPKKDKKGNIIYQQKVDKKGNPVFVQAKNPAGQLQYKTVYKSKTVNEGEGFTDVEQQQLLADFLKANFPEGDFNAEEIGGAAKSIYDELVAVNRNNYTEVPGFDKLSEVILNTIGSADANVAAEMIRKYKDDVRKQTGKRFMSLAEDLAAGKDAKELIGNALSVASSYLETNIDENDSLVKQLFNFKDDKGVYRMPNDLELYQLLDNDPRAAYTSRKKNEAINMFETLKSRLQRG